jgi:hypothetical protein
VSLAACLVALVACMAGVAALEQAHRRARDAARHLRPARSRPAASGTAALNSAADRLGGSVDARLRR